jgi:hypothetical protein
MSDFIFRGRQKSITNADFGAPRSFALAIPFDLSNAASQYIDTIDYSIIVQPADNAALGVLVVEIYRNLAFEDNENFDNQILGNSSARRMWHGQTDTLGARSKTWQFSAPRGFQLEAGYRYSALAFMTNLQGVLANAVLNDFFITGRVAVSEIGVLYGEER